MKRRSSNGRTLLGKDGQLDEIIEQFEEAWLAGERPEIDRFVARIANPAQRHAILAELVHVEFERRHLMGDNPTIEEYLERYPQLAQDAAVVAELIDADQTLRSARGETLSTLDYLRRFPEAAEHCMARRRIGRFRLLEPLGSGAFGVVWKSIDPELDRPVAVKVPHPTRCVAPADRERFLREARSCAQLRHPGIVSVHEAGVHEGIPYLVSEYVEGRTLAQILAERHFSPFEAAQLAAEVAESLHHAHANGVIHRDIKPSNIMLSGPRAEQESSQPTMRQARIMDFGLARRAGVDASLTMEGQILGTPAYISPEVARDGAKTADARTDIYSLGVVLYQLLTGALPFPGEGPTILHGVLHTDPPPPRRLNNAIPVDLEAVCLKCIEKQPTHRYASAQELADDLRRVLAGQPTTARPMGALRRIVKWVHRRPAVACLGMICIILGASLLYLNSRHIYELHSVIDESNKLRVDTESGRAAEERQRLADLSRLYASDMLLAHQHLNNGEFEQAHDILCQYDDGTPKSRLRSFEWYYLARLASVHIETIPGCGVDVYFVTSTPDRNEIVTGSKDGKVRWWDLRMHPAHCRAVLNAHTSCVNRIEYSPDDRWLATASCDHSVKLWDANTRELAAELRGPGSPANDCRFSPDGTMLAAAFGDLGTPAWTGVFIWNIHTHQLVTEIPTNGTVESLANSPDGKYLAFGEEGERQLNLYEWSTRIKRSIRSPESFGYGADLIFSSAGNTLVAQSGSGVSLLRFPELTKERFYPKGSTHCQGFALSPDDRSIILGMFSGDLMILPTTGETQEAKVDIGQGSIWHVEFLRDRQTVATANSDGTVTLCRPDRLPEAVTIVDRTFHLGQVIYSSQPDTIHAIHGLTFHGAICSYRRTSEGWESMGEPVSPEQQDRDIPPTVALAARIGAAPFTATRLPRVSTSHPVEKWRIHECESISADGQRVTRLERNEHQTTVQIWSVRPPALIREWSIAQTPRSLHAVSADGELAVVDNGGPPEILNLTTGQRLYSMSEIRNNVSTAVFSVNGCTLAVAGSNRVDVVEARSGQPICWFSYSGTIHGGVDFSPDGRRIAIAENVTRPRVRVFDADLGEETLILEQLPAEIHRVLISPDGRSLIAIGQPTSDLAQIYLWSGEPYE